jgi:hypothetical protein
VKADAEGGGAPRLRLRRLAGGPPAPGAGRRPRGPHRRARRARRRRRTPPRRAREVEVPEGCSPPTRRPGHPRRRRPGHRGDRRHRAGPHADPRRARERRLVVTANKALLAEDGATLFEAAEKAGATSTTRPRRRRDPDPAAAARVARRRPVTRVLGIVNGTTNFILDKMDTSGAGFAEALEEAQALGYAEADPTADVEGFDAAAKAAILASLAFHTRVTAADVTARASRVTAADVASAREMGCVVKLLAICELRDRRGVGRDRRVRVHPAMIPRSHPLASVREAYNAVFVESEAAGQLMFYGPGAGGSPTASAVLGDLVTVARNRLAGTRGAASRRTPTGRCCRWARPSPATTSPRRRRPRRRARRGRDAFAEHGRVDPDRPPGGPRRRRPARRRLAPRDRRPARGDRRAPARAWTSSARSPR